MSIPSRRLGAAKDKEAVRQLANDLLKEGQQGQGNSPSQVHVLLSMALEVAEVVGDLAIVEGAIGDLDKQFLVDGPVLKYGSGLRMTRNGQTGGKPADLVRLFVEAGLGCVTLSPVTARKALAEAEQQARRCYGTKGVYDEAQKAVASLKEGIQKARVDADRLGTGEAVPRVAVPAEHDADRIKARAAIKASQLAATEPMRDDGKSGDGAAGDGTQAFSLPAAPAGETWRFWIEAVAADSDHVDRGRSRAPAS